MFQIGERVIENIQKDAFTNNHKRMEAALADFAVGWAKLFVCFIDCVCRHSNSDSFHKEADVFGIAVNFKEKSASPIIPRRKISRRPHINSRRAAIWDKTNINI